MASAQRARSHGAEMTAPARTSGRQVAAALSEPLRDDVPAHGEARHPQGPARELGDEACHHLREVAGLARVVEPRGAGWGCPSSRESSPPARRAPPPPPRTRGGGRIVARLEPSRPWRTTTVGASEGPCRLTSRSRRRRAPALAARREPGLAAGEPGEDGHEVRPGQPARWEIGHEHPLWGSRMAVLQ